MLTSITTLVFSILTIVFLAGIAIIIKNLFKMKSLSNHLKRIINTNMIDDKYSPTRIEKFNNAAINLKQTSTLHKLLLIQKPILQLPDSAHETKMVN